MPYILPERREEHLPLETAGELNFSIHRLILAYQRKHGLSYQTINDILGVLAAVPQEYYRRVVAEYEDEKIMLNGDVYDEPEH